jgi:hypothetical protein
VGIVKNSTETDLLLVVVLVNLGDLREEFPCLTPIPVERHFSLEFPGCVGRVLFDFGGKKATGKVDSLGITDPRPLLPNGPNPPLFFALLLLLLLPLLLFTSLIFPLRHTMAGHQSLPTGTTPYTQ